MTPNRVGAYRIVARIGDGNGGEGGTGSLYRGERAAGDFAHVAAIKLLPPGARSDARTVRFQRERQALAALTHPHIAQLYDGGETDEGAPYIIMEYVDGLPLLPWVEAHRPDGAARRRLFGDICTAIAFAHRNLIVHNDLKASDILVTGDGTVKLTGFGQAAPEGAAGGPVTTAADIAALGRLLDELFPAADSELRAIVARATAQDPADRYPTAEALSADVDAWGADFPVAAMDGGRAYAARKFAGRHRVAVSAAATALLLLLGAFGLTLHAWRAAETARAAEAARFDQLRALANYMVGGLHDRLEPLPGTAALRARTAEVGRAYLERLLRDRGDAHDLDAELAAGYATVGHVFATTSTNATGDVAAGRAALARAERLLRERLALHPNDRASQILLARVLTWRSGIIGGADGDVAAANRALDEAFALYDTLLADDPADLDAAYGRWNTAMGRADVLQTSGGWDALLALARDDQHRAATLPVPPERAGLRALFEAADENATGDALYYGGHGLANALPHYRSAVAILDRADATLPYDVRRRIRSIAYHYQVASSYQEMGDLARALRWSTRGVERADALIRVDDSAAALTADSVIRFNHALLLSELGHHDAALATARQDIARQRERAARSPDDRELRVRAAGTQDTLIEILDAAGRAREACDVARAALAEWDAIARAGPIPQPYARDVPIIAARARRCPGGGA